MKGKVVLMLCLAGLLVSGGLAASNGKGLGHASQSSISAEALKGPNVTDLMIYVPSDVTIAKKIQVKAYYTNGTNKFTRNFLDVPAANGVVRIQFDNLERREKVDVSLQMDKGGWLEASAVVYLRPDLVIASVTAAEKVLVGDRLFVNVSVQEINGDLGADAAVVLLEGSTVLDTVNVSMNAGGNANAVLSTVFASIGKYNLSVRVTNTVPAEYDEKNNEKPLAVGVVAPDLSVSSVTAPDSVTVGERFDVSATISELNGETGANATVALLEGSTVLDTKTLYVPAKGSGIVSLGGILDTAGSHNITVRIIDSVPSDNFPGNNEQSVTIMAAVKVVLPDLSVSNVTAPASVAVGQGFGVLANISELNGVAANATVALLENDTVLDSNMLDVSAGGSGVVSLNASLNITGNHTLAVRIITSVPPDTFAGNNEQFFVILAIKPPEPMSFSSNYYYQNTSLNNSRYITSLDYEDRGEELELREDEIISLTASSNKSIGFPLRVHISITNGTGEGNAFEEIGVVPTLVEGGRKTFIKYYNESSTLLTIGVDGNGTSVSIESKANNSLKYSRGYQHWWFKPATEWNIATNSSNGRLIRARESLQVRIELEDGSRFLGGNAVTAIGNVSYIGGWTDTTDGLLTEQRSVWTYSGNGSGDTVI